MDWWSFTKTSYRLKARMIGITINAAPPHTKSRLLFILLNVWEPNKQQSQALTRP